MFSDKRKVTGAVVAAPQIPRWAGSVTIALRLIVLPALGLVIMLSIEPIVPSILTPVMRAVVILNWASPAANNAVVLCQRVGLGDLAESLAAMYVPMYLLCLLSVPAY